MFDLVEDGGEPAQALLLLPPAAYPAWRAQAAPAAAAWLDRIGFSGAAGDFTPLPDAPTILAITEDPEGPWSLSGLAAALPPGRYALEGDRPTTVATRAALSWALGRYRFDRYRPPPDRSSPQLVWPLGAERAEVIRTASAVALARDLINTPAEDMGPAELEDAARRLAESPGAELAVTTGEALLASGYPALHAVGRASPRPPRMIDLRWGDEQAPRVTLVGKGICFDTGGLNLKPPEAMRAMKVDMGGAAVLLALAQALMSAGAPIRLRLLIAAADNAVSGAALRPGDILATRAGKSVEVTDTDAEGRLILADALAEAVSETPDLIVDCATLTGAARVALGPEIQAFFTRDDDLAAELSAAADHTDDPLWRMPLWAGYRPAIQGRISDLINMVPSPFGGAISAALFLAEFVPARIPWVHLDIFAGNASARPGRPEGGEATGLHALHAWLRRRYG